MKKIKDILEKTKIWFTDHYHILFKSAAVNHLRIQELLKNPDGTYQLTVKFNSYSELKNYQKKLRRLTVSLSSAVAMIIVAVIVSPYILNPNRSSAAAYQWIQTGWGTHVTDPDNSNASYASNKTNWNQFYTKDTNVVAQSNNVELSIFSSEWNQDSDSDFNAGNLDSGKISVSGTGAAATLKLNKTASANAWQSLATSPFTGIGYVSMVYLDNYIYAMTGSKLSKYDIANNTWDTNLPLAPASIAYMGAESFTYDGRGNLYALDYVNSRFMKYDIVANAWTHLVSVSPISLSNQNAVTALYGDYIYVVVGNSTSSFLRYNIVTNEWLQDIAQLPGTMNGSKITSDNNGNIYILPKIYNVVENPSSSFFKYNIASNNWTQLTSTVGYTYMGGMAYDGMGHIYSTTGGYGTSAVAQMTGFYRYDIASNNWVSLSVTKNYRSSLECDSKGNVYFFAPYYNGVTTASNVFNRYNTNDYYPPGTYTSTIYDTNGNNGFGNISWLSSVPTGASVKILVRSSNDPLMVTGTHAWDDSCIATMNGDLSDISACVTDGQRYIQYQAILTAGSGGAPTLDNVSINLISGYPTTSQKLISSPFNTGNKYNSVQGLTWTASNDEVSTQGEVKFQIRTAPDNGSGSPDWTNSKWCGPSGCSATLNSTTEFAGDWYTDANGDGTLDIAEINATQKNSEATPIYNDQWIQYATFMKSTTGAVTPSLTNVTLKYSFNIPPTVTLNNDPTKLKQNSNGTFSVPYTVSEKYDDFGNLLHGTSSSKIKTALFYQPKNDLTLPAIDSAYVGNITFNNPSTVPIPKSGSMLIDSELITFDDNGGTLTGNIRRITGRGASFISSYPTSPSGHNASSAVFFMASPAVQEIGEFAATGGVINSTVTSSEKTFIWDPRNDASSNLSGVTLGTFLFKVVAHDADSLSANAIGQSSLTAIQSLDLKLPSISLVSTDASHTSLIPTLYYNSSSSQIPVKINFSENVNFDPTGGKVITITLNSGTCTISSSITKSSQVTCQYSIGGSDITPMGESLKVSAISTTGVIKDDFDNILENFAPTANLDAVTSIVIDSVAPTANDLSDVITKASFPKSLVNVNDNLSGIATYAWSKVSGTGNITFSAPSTSTTNISSDTDGVFVIKAKITDKAGNFEEKTFNLTWDTTNPSAAGKPNVPTLTNNNKPLVSWDKSIDALSGLAKYEVQRKTGEAGIFATVHTITDETTLAATTASFTESIPLADETYYYQIIATDKAGNSSISSVSDAMKIDTTPATLQSFTSNKANADAATAYGKDEVIDIRATYDEPLNTGSIITVQLENSASPAVDVILNTIETVNGKGILSGTFTVDGPRKGYDTPDLNIRSVVSENAIDMAGNIKTTSSTDSLTQGNLADNKNIFIDTGTPILSSFSAKKLPATTSGSFKQDESLQITATYSKLIASGSITVRLNTENGSEDIEDIVLNTISGATISGVYTVKTADNVDELKVSSITAQSATDFKGNILSNTGTMAEYDAYFMSLSGENIPAVINILNIQIDTAPPTLGSPAISYSMIKTNNQTPTANISATDNFNLSDGTMQFSLNGTNWCTPVAYSSINSFDITNTICGGNSSNEIKTVHVRFFDQAGNESSTSSATIEYDNSAPTLEKITAVEESGTYGPGSTIKIIAQYNEDLKAGSTMTIQFNSGKQITLDQIENLNQLTKIYTVGATGSLEDSSKLKAGSIVSQSVSDTATPTNTQDSISLAGISENIDTNKTIIIDTTAPSGSIIIDRSVTSGQVIVAATDQNGMDNAQVEIKTIDALQSCGFTDIWLPYEANLITDLAESNVASIKGCIQFKDKSGNVSAYETKTPETPSGIQLDDVSNINLTPPFLGSIFTWQKPANFGEGNLFSQYEQLRCESADGNDCVPDRNSPMSVTDLNQNYYVNTSLASEKKYCYQVRFKDQHGNFSKLSDTVCAVSGQAPLVTDSKVNIISGEENDILITDITETSAKIVFSTRDTAHNNKPVLTKAIVQTYDDPQFTRLVATSAEEPDYTVTHIIPVTGLAGGAQYYLRITATDSSDISNPDRTTVLEYDPSGIPALTFTTIGILKTISNVTEEVVTDSKAVITFKTDQDAKCFIDSKESTTEAFNDLSDNLESNFAKNHSITLTELLAKTAYNYKVTCTDNKGTVITSDVFDLTTSEKGLTQGDIDASQDGKAPEISNVSLAAITGENATVTWTTNEAASSMILYEAEGNDFMLMAGDSSVSADTSKYSTNHIVTVKNLIPASKYIFSVMSHDAAGNIGQSVQSTFTTKEPSALSSIKVLSKSLGQATITWETGSATSSLVEYGLTTSYGQKKEDTSKTKDHTITLSDLTPGETYHFRVRGEDDQKNIFASSDITFQPKAPPKISDFKVDSITEHEAVVTFTTNVHTDSLITYSDLSSQENSGFQGKPEVTTKHETKLKGLTSGTEFSLKLKVRDEEGNETEETFPNFTTTKDEKPPVIDRVKTDSALTQNDKVQAIISWSTDELSTGEILYKEGRTGDEKRFEVNSAPSFSHIGVVTSFKSGVVYYFKVKSKDLAGNEIVSSDYALLTPKQRQNIIQVIIGNFTDIFGWAKF